jgi:glucose/arabinose dehydrogenase
MTKLWSTLSLSLTGLVSVACGLGLVSAPVAGSATVFPKTEAVAAPSGAIEVVPELRVTTVLNGLDIPWDTAFLPDGAMLVTERVARRILLRTPTGEVRVVADQLPGIWAEGETGLMSLAVDPRFAQNRRFYTCQGGHRHRSRHARGGVAAQRRQQPREPHRGARVGHPGHQRATRRLRARARRRWGAVRRHRRRHHRS